MCDVGCEFGGVQRCEFWAGRLGIRRCFLRTEGYILFILIFICGFDCLNQSRFYLSLSLIYLLQKLQAPKSNKYSRSITMAPITQTVYSEGIFHGLPTFPSHDGKKYTAIVTGANGISGSEIVNRLASAPERWETIYALSRRSPKNSNPRVKSISADFLASTPEELAAIFKKEGIQA